MASWGTLGATLELEGASSRSWKLRFERRLAPRETSAIANPASSVWLVRDEASSRLYAAKRQALASLVEVDALVDEAAAWRAACLADENRHIVELVDVFVDRTVPHSVTFLAEFCSKGLLPPRDVSEPVLLTIIADLSAAAAVMPSPHAHITYDSLLVDEKGCIRLAGFGAHRSAILRDNPGLTPSDDSFDIGLLLYELIFGRAPPDDLFIPSDSPYSPAVINLIQLSFSHPHPNELRDAAISAGAAPRAPIVNPDKARTTDAEDVQAPVHVSRAVERNVDRLVEGTDIGPTFAALLSDLDADPGVVGPSIFKALYKKPVSKDPLCATRAFTMLHNLMLDGPEAMLAVVRGKDKFLQWAESSWDRNTVQTKLDEEGAHQSIRNFAQGELAFYVAFLRRKARFHQLAANSLTGRWDRTGVTNAEGRDVLESRRRKVVNGITDLVEMASELGSLFASATDPDAPVKHAGLGAMLSECCLAFNAGLELAQEVYTLRDAERVAPAIDRLYTATRKLVFAVEHVPSAGGESWVAQFSPEQPPDVVAEFVSRQAELNQHSAEVGEFPKEGWEGAEAKLGDETEGSSKGKKKKKKKKKDADETPAPVEEPSVSAELAQPAEELTAADGALVVHGADEASNAVTAMFGELLRLDEDKEEPVDDGASQMRPLDHMSNTQALASAFGVSEEAYTASYDDTEENPYGHDYEEEGGYADYQARQEGGNVSRAREAREARGPSTASWASRAGYGVQALVVSDVSRPVKKAHPSFCQCALCQREEEQAAAREESFRGGDQYFDEQTAHDASHGGAYDGLDRNGDNWQERENSMGHAHRSKYSAGDADSLDEDAAGTSWKREGNQGGGRDRSYYQDDYDSYESVTYAVDEANPERGADVPAASAIPLRGPGDFAVPIMAPKSSGPKKFALDAKQVLNVKKLRTGDKLSDGEFIVVYDGEYNREKVAVKKLTKKGIRSKEAVAEFLNEVEVMCSLSHENIMPCMAASITKPDYVFVTQMMKRGTLFSVLYKSRIKLTLAMVRKMALQIAKGLLHMHEQGFLHRDLKSLNVFVDGSYNIKVGDFGLSRSLSQNQEGGISGTYQYMAPEVLRGEPHSFKSDVFSFAILLNEMISAELPFHGMDPRDVGQRVVSEDLRPVIPRSCQRSLVNIIQQCWASVPSTRPSFAQVVNLLNFAQ